MAMTTAGVELDVCSGCHGVWLDPAEWLSVFGRQGESTPKADPPDTTLTCPACPTPTEPGYGEPVAASLQACVLADLPDVSIHACSRCKGT